MVMIRQDASGLMDTSPVMRPTSPNRVCQCEVSCILCAVSCILNDALRNLCAVSSFLNDVLCNLCKVSSILNGVLCIFGTCQAFRVKCLFASSAMLFGLKVMH